MKSPSLSIAAGILLLALLPPQVEAGRILFADDFSTGLGTLGSINGWTDGGPEDKDYNVGGSGMLVVQDANGDEKGTGPHAGFFDNLFADIGSSVQLLTEGDWIRLSMDFEVFPGSYGGASVADSTAGLRISFTESGSSTDAGYGLYIATGSATTHTFREMKGPASSQSTIGNALTGVDLPENAGLQNLTVLLTHVGTGVRLEGSLAGNALTTRTNTNVDILDNQFDTIGVSVAAYDHGVRIDNVTVEVPDTSSLWNQFVYARTNGLEPILPDFSYAGYHCGDDPLPTVSWTVFDVTSYGAVPDDSLSDKAAINSAIAAAEANGSGIILFPPGRFRINEPVTPWVNDPIVVQGSRIVFRGSGRGPGGTELFMNRHMDPTDPAKLWSAPKMIQLKGNGTVWGTSSSVVADTPRESHTLTVANGSTFQVGEWIRLRRQDTSAAAVAEAVAPYTVDVSWTSIINDGVVVEDVHQIDAINGNDITFKTPIHHDVLSSGNWSAILFDPLEEVGVEQIAFTGNWTSNFVHHGSFYDDSGWGALSYSSTVNSWIRQCRFTDWSVCMGLGFCSGVTVRDIKLDGNKGHSAITVQDSSNCFVGMVDDTAGHHHACGVGRRSSGNVFWKSEYRDDTCFESHASQPRNTLFDNMTGGWKYGRWGGAQGNQPNHLERLIFWNYENTGSGEPGLFEFMRSASVFGRIIMPYVVGFHGNPQSFDTSQIAVLESNGTAVEPASLYEAQYQLRTGKPFTELLYAEWAAGHGLTGADSELTADPDADFRANLYEYGVGGFPAAGTNHPGEESTFRWIADGSFTGMELVYSRRRNADPLGLTYTVESTSDLRNPTWPSEDVAETGASVINETFESVTNRAPALAAPQAFLRLNIHLKE